MIELNRKQQEELLKLARRTIADNLEVNTVIDLDEFSDPVFREKCGAFVTLHIRKNLRGCIWIISGVKSVPETIRRWPRPRHSAIPGPAAGPG
jgi:AMMECR1 domain-containing protein